MSFKHLLSEGGVFYDSWILATSNDAKIKKAKSINFKFDSFTIVFVQELRNIPLRIEILLFYGLTQLFYLKCHYLHADCKNAIKNISAYWINKKLAQKELAAKRKKDLASFETTYETVTFDATQAEADLSTSILPDEPSRKRKRTLQKTQRLVSQRHRFAKSLQVHSLTGSPTASVHVRSIDDGQAAGPSSISCRQQEEPMQPVAPEQQMEVQIENELEPLHLYQNVPEVILHEDIQMQVSNEPELLDLRADEPRSDNYGSEIETPGWNANELPQPFDNIVPMNDNLEISSLEEPATKRSCISTNEGVQISVEQRTIQPVQEQQPQPQLEQQQQIENEMEVEETASNKRKRQVKKGGAKMPGREVETAAVVENNNQKKRKRRRRRHKRNIYKERKRIIHFRNGLFGNIFMEHVHLLENVEERMRPTLDFLDSSMGSKNTYDFLNTVNEKLSNVKFVAAKVIVEETENLFASTFANASKRNRGSNCALQDLQSRQQQFLNSNSMHVLDQTNLTVGNAASILVQPDEQLGNSLLLDNNSLQCFNQSQHVLVNEEPELSFLTNENSNATNMQIGNFEPTIEAPETTKERIGNYESIHLNDSLLGYNETNMNNISIVHHRITEDKSEKFFDDELKPIIKESQSNQIKFSDLKKGKSRFNVCMTFNYLLYLKKNKKIDLKQRDSKSDIEVTLINPF